MRRRGMCLGIPGEIVEILPDQPDLAKVDVSGVRRNINIGLITDDDPQPGDWILIHVGFALSKIDEAEAKAAMDFLEGIGQAYADEIEALMESRIEWCASSRSPATRTSPVPWPPRSRACASRAGSTSSWRSAAGTRTRSTST